MLTEAENELLCATDRGTPGGELMRRYWQPAALSAELPPGGAPLPVRLMGEDLVLFRNDQGRPGLLGLHCSHRGADLSYGRLEDGGLRCIYHGWLYDIHGRCLEQPGEPAPSIADFGLRSAESVPAQSAIRNGHSAIKHTAYPCVERSGVIFAYLGPGEPPLLPDFEFLTCPSENVIAMKLFNDCNYLQGNEGNIDLIHLSFLHLDIDRRGPDGRGGGFGLAPGVSFSGKGAAPHMEVVEAELLPFGLRVCKIRDLGDQHDLYVGTFCLPSFFVFGGTPATGYSLNWHVPIDDAHHWKYTFRFRRDGPYGADGRRQGGAGAEKTADHRSVRNKVNRYLQDREAMKTHSYTGIVTVNQPQDLCVIEGAGPIQDRTQEHLGAADAPLVASRHLLFRAFKDVQEGIDPPGVIRDPDANHFPYNLGWQGVISAQTDWREHLRQLDSAAYGGEA